MTLWPPWAENAKVSPLLGVGRSLAADGLVGVGSSFLTLDTGRAWVYFST